ncbi:MAG: MbcA/ParS/Xre antitoxin family protein [Rhodocyclaceae bacterium]|nr:MbcA/ParS/Xre antitoxin family protein [Rhodocyclaceae bacterium]
MAPENLNQYQLATIAVAEDVWASTKDAEMFMLQPHVFLDGKTPLEVSKTEDGAKQVESILQAIRWGLPR